MLAISLVVTLLVSAYAWVSIEAREGLRFQGAAQDAAGTISGRIETYTTILWSARALFAASDSVSRDQFRLFVESLHLTSQYPGIQGLGYSVRVSADQLPSVEGFLKRDVGPDARVWPDSVRPEYHVIVYLEPFDRRNRAALGYDMFADPARRAAMERARDTGTPVASSPVRLVQEIDDEKQLGFLIYLPVYETAVTPRELEERRNQLRGFVYMPFRVNDLFAGIFGATRRWRVELQVFDGDSTRADRLIFSSIPVANGQPVKPVGERRVTSRLMVAGRRWTVLFHDHPGALISSGMLMGGLVLLIGTAVSLTLYAATSAQARDRAAALRIAADLRRSQAEIGELNRDLERRVEDRTAAAEARARELVRSNADLEQFAYVASHDLQEPLRMVANYTQLLARRYAGKLGPDADEYIEFAVDGVRRMESLIRGLLAYSRVGGQPWQWRSVDLQQVARQALTNLGQAISESEAEVSLGALPTVHGDAAQLQQVFQNLISNAIKFRRPEEPPRIVVESVQDGHPADSMIEVRVADNGIGIAPEHSDRVFVIFQRLHTRDEYPGTGIGLAICKKIIERHGGRIWVQPGPEQGAEVRFTLPA